MITHHYSAERQTAKKNLRTSKNQLNLLTVTFLAIEMWIEINLRCLIVYESVKRAKY